MRSILENIRQALSKRVVYAIADDEPNDADERFESENKNQRVRPSVHDQPPSVRVPLRISRRVVQEWDIVPAEDIAELTRRLGQDTWVIGRVHGVHIPAGGSPVIFNMQQDHREAFNFVIFEGDLQRWGLSAEQVSRAYQGKDVVVGGPIAMFRDRPQIVVTIHSQIYELQR